MFLCDRLQCRKPNSQTFWQKSELFIDDGQFLEEKLTRHLLSEYEHLFDGLKGEIVVLRVFLGTKTLDNCPQYRGGHGGHDDDEVDVSCALLEESDDDEEENNNSSGSVECSTETEEGYNASVWGQTIFGL